MRESVYVIESADAIAKLVSGYKPRKKANLKLVRKAMIINGTKCEQKLWVKK